MLHCQKQGIAISIDAGIQISGYWLGADDRTALTFGETPFFALDR